MNWKWKVYNYFKKSSIDITMADVEEVKANAGSGETEEEHD